jgi:hypothetical protein
MKKIGTLVLLQLLFGLLTACGNDDPSDDLQGESYLFDCIETLHEDDACALNDNRLKLDAAISDFIQNRDYEFNDYEASYSVDLGFAIDTTVSIRILMNRLSVDLALYQSAIALTDDMYHKLSELVVDDRYKVSVTILDTIDTPSDAIAIRQQSWVGLLDDSDPPNRIRVDHYVSQLTLSTVSDNKALIEAILDAAPQYDIHLNVVEYDPTIDDFWGSVRYLYVTSDRAESMIQYRLQPDNSQIVHEFTDDEFYQTLIDEFPNHTFLLIQE